MDNKLIAITDLSLDGLQQQTLELIQGLVDPGAALLLQDRLVTLGDKVEKTSKYYNTIPVTMTLNSHLILCRRRLWTLSRVENKTYF